MGIFSKNRGVEPLLQGMVDIHSHLMYGVDDGASSVEDSMAIIECYRGLGINQCYATPHILPALYNNSEEQLTNLFNERMVPLSLESDFEISLAAEYMVSSEFIAKLNSEERLLTLENMYLLLEVEAFRAFSQNTIDIFLKAKNCGYNPILAHPERYQLINSDVCDKLKKCGVSLQLNLLSLSGYYGNEAKQKSLWLLNNNYYDFVGIDSHSVDTFKMIDKISLPSKSYTTLEKIVRNNIIKFKL